jgi:hemoglobin
MNSSQESCQHDARSASERARPIGRRHRGDDQVAGVHILCSRAHDALLGPVFSRAIEDWDAHLDKLCAFWSSVTLMTGRYKGTPMKAHAELPEITPAHFECWLALFHDAAIKTCSPDAAQIFVDRAHRIAESLQLGIALHRGEDVAPPVRRGPPIATPDAET